MLLLYKYIKTFFSALFTITVISISLFVWFMSAYFIKDGIPAIIGGELYPVIILAVPVFIFILIVAVFFIWSLYGERVLGFTYTILLFAFLLVYLGFSTAFPEYRNSPQRMVLRFTGIG